MSASDLVAGYYWCRYCEIATPGSWELFRRDAWGRWEEAFNSRTDDWTALSDEAFRRVGYEVGACIPGPYALSAHEARIAELEKALEPFAEFGAHAADDRGWASNVDREGISVWFGPSDFRLAARALSPLNKEGDNG